MDQGVDPEFAAYACAIATYEDDADEIAMTATTPEPPSPPEACSSLLASQHGDAFRDAWHTHFGSISVARSVAMKASQNVVDIVTDLGVVQRSPPANKKELNAAVDKEDWLIAERKALDVILAGKGNHMIKRKHVPKGERQKPETRKS